MTIYCPKCNTEMVELRSDQFRCHECDYELLEKRYVTDAAVYQDYMTKVNDFGIWLSEKTQQIAEKAKSQTDKFDIVFFAGESLGLMSAQAEYLKVLTAFAKALTEDKKKEPDSRCPR